MGSDRNFLAFQEGREVLVGLEDLVCRRLPSLRDLPEDLVVLLVQACHPCQVGLVGLEDQVVRVVRVALEEPRSKSFRDHQVVPCLLAHQPDPVGQVDLEVQDGLVDHPCQVDQHLLEAQADLSVLVAREVLVVLVGIFGMVV